jgi:type II restriction enzyme
MKAFVELQGKIKELISFSHNFDTISKDIYIYIEQMPLSDFLECLSEIGIIPESVVHDSTEEKFYAKVSDCILSRGFSELGLKSTVLTQRGDAADVMAESVYHKYSLVGDAKIFRLSRTAKNQKDFKVAGLDSWRNDSEYAVLCSPLYQYPLVQSQVYKEALERNVLLFSWEYLKFLLVNHIKESADVSLEGLWNFSAQQATNTTVDAIKNRFLASQTQFISEYGKEKYAKQNSFIELDELFSKQITSVEARSTVEKEYWNSVTESIKGYTREEAIIELLKEKKIYKKIEQITRTVRGVKKGFEN